MVAVIDDELTCEDVTSPEDVKRLNVLELYRLLYHTPDLPMDIRAAASSAWHALPREPTVYPVNDGHSWREGVDRALADDSGTDASDASDAW